MPLKDLISSLGVEIDSSEEETFLLFSRQKNSQDLGLVDSKATTLDVSVGGRDLTVSQSPMLLSSNRAGGTTGAALWKITPLFAQWLTTASNVLFRSSVLGQGTIVLELGSGIGVVAIALACRVRRYIATDQEYVFKLLKANIAGNRPKRRHSSSVVAQHPGKARRYDSNACAGSSIEVIALDWESSLVSGLPAVMGTDSAGASQVIGAVIACDCIYNEALITPFVSTCADICRLANAHLAKDPTLCIVAQQLRSDMVFKTWLEAFCTLFKVWRVPDDLLIDGLKEGSGFAVHVGILREHYVC